MAGILQPNVELELDEGEQILYYTRRHWTLLVVRAFIPFLIAAGSLLLAVYRAAGGVFFEPGAAAGRLFDFSNVVVLALIVALVLVWTQQSGRQHKGKKPGPYSGVVDALFLLVVLVLGLVIYFRYQGGRIFYVDPANAAGADLLNIVLFVSGVVAALWLIYIVIDWANDFLVLTNTRVIYDDTQLLVRHVQQSLLLEDIQQVNLSADSYVAHFLGYLALWRDQFMHWAGLRNEPPPEKATVAYGKIVIGSLSLQRLLFERAANPHAMVQRINAELGKLRKQQEPELLRQIIEDQVYGRKSATTPKPMIFVETRRGPIPWLFKPNPEINPKTEEIVWRPFWIFLAFAMLPAVVALILTTILLILAVRVGFIGAGPSFSIWLLVALVCLARIIWVREEHENDKYILTRDRIIDVDKKPFGPESSRVAQLGNIQNVSSDVSFVESIFGYGDVMITTGGGGGAFTFKHVPDPRNVQATITDYLTDFKKREKARAQQATLDLIKQYHEGQLRHEELLSEKQIQTVADKVNERLAVDVPSQVEREITTQLTDVVRRELARSGLRRRRRP